MEAGEACVLGEVEWDGGKSRKGCDRKTAQGELPSERSRRWWVWGDLLCGVWR